MKVGVYDGVFCWEDTNDQWFAIVVLTSADVNSTTEIQPHTKALIADIAKTAMFSSAMKKDMAAKLRKEMMLQAIATYLEIGEPRQTHRHNPTVAIAGTKLAKTMDIPVKCAEIT